MKYLDKAVELLKEPETHDDGVYLLWSLGYTRNEIEEISKSARTLDPKVGDLHPTYIKNGNTHMFCKVTKVDKDSLIIEITDIDRDTKIVTNYIDYKNMFGQLKFKTEINLP